MLQPSYINDMHSAGEVLSGSETKLLSDGHYFQWGLNNEFSENVQNLGRLI